MPSLNNNQKFYADKNLEFTEELNNKADEQTQASYEEQIKNRDDILSEIGKVLLSYTIFDGIMSLKDTERKNLYSKLSKIVNEKLQSELKNETKLTKEVLNFVGKEKYNANNYIHSIGVNFNITPVDDDTLEKIINTKVDNEIWRNRLRDNKNKIAKDLRSEIKEFLKGKSNVNQIEGKIKKKYNANTYNTKRLVQDNVARVQEGINDIWRGEHSIKHVLYMATLCGNTCADCRQYDGKSYEVTKKPVILPQHCFCRCTYVSIPNADWHPKMRLDNETKENINWQSFEEWKENQSTMSGVSNSAKWTNKGEKITKEQFRDLRDYAGTKGIALSEFKNFDGDVELVKNAIDDMSMIANKYPKLIDEKKNLTLKLNYYMDDEDFAQAKGHILNINGKAFRNKELLENEYFKLSKSGWFTPNTSYRAIVKHEMGHMVHDAYKIDTISIGKDILGINNNKELFKGLRYNLSEYASIYTDGSEILSEVFAEVYDSKKPRNFSLKFMEKIDKMI